MSVEIRARTSADLPVLVDLLWDQQPESSYPLRNPLPFPTSSFLHADDADAAWIATIDGRGPTDIRQLSAEVDVVPRA